MHFRYLLYTYKAPWGSLPHATAGQSFPAKFNGLLEHFAIEII
jgi:hypothetical protein